jgi:hypothetical protein
VHFRKKTRDGAKVLKIHRLQTTVLREDIERSFTNQMVELFLIVAVWRRGWGPLALTPTAFTVLVGFALQGASPDTRLAVLIPLVLLELSALVLMLRHPPKNQTADRGTEATELERATTDSHTELL